MSAAPNLRCNDILTFLDAYIEERLPAETIKSFERHLAVCPSCIAYLDSYRMTIALVRETERQEVAADAPEELIAAIVRTSGFS